MKKRALLILGLLLAAQLLIPAAMIVKHERILRTGELYRFKTRPIDPADPWQGRYVQLQFDEAVRYQTQSSQPVPERNERVFVILGTDADGFCQIKGWSRTKPKSGNYLKLTYTGFPLRLPFNRFYMEESQAPRAETLAREATRSTNCWANVRILNGDARIEDVLIGGTSLRELAGQPRR